MKHILPQLRCVSCAIVLGEKRAAAHAQSDQDGGQKGHQRIGRAHSRKGVGSNAPAHHQGIHQIVDLLEHITRNHRQAETHQAT